MNLLSEWIQYLGDPLVLIGFFLLLFTGILRMTLRRGGVSITKKSTAKLVDKGLTLAFFLGILIIVLGFGLRLFEILKKPEVPNLVVAEEQLQDLLMPANEPDPQHRCKDIPPDAFKIFMGGNLSWSNPNNEVTALSIDGQDIIVLSEEPEGFFLSAILYREDRRVVARIVRNKFEINPNNFFRIGRPDRHELNIFDKDNRRILHVRFLNETAFIIEGSFYGPKRNIKITQDELICEGMHFSGICTYVEGAKSSFYRF